MERPIRLSPSGPFIRDSVSDVPVQTGTGSTGIVWRAQGTSGSTTDVSTPAALTAIPGLEREVNMVPGLRYDVHASLTLLASASTSQNVTVSIEGSTDGGSTWTVTGIQRSDNIRLGNGGGQIEAGEVEFDRSAATETIDRIRCRIWAQEVATVPTVSQDDNCFLRVEQFAG